MFDIKTFLDYPLLVRHRSGGSFKREYREFLAGALWPSLTLSGLLGLRLGPWGRTDGIKWLGKVVAFSCLFLSQIGCILTEPYVELRSGSISKEIYNWEIYI